MISSPLRRLTVLITGAHGFIGRHLVRSLRTIGADIHAVARGTANPLAGIQYHSGDVTNLPWLRGVIEACSPDVIYHLTSCSLGGQDATNVLPNFTDDLQATVHTLVAAEQCGPVRVILASSMEEPILDGRPVQFSSPYALAKTCCTLYGHLFHQLYHLPVVMLRTFMTYGPGQKTCKIVPYNILSLLRGEAPRLSNGIRGVDWVYVDDVIRAFVEAATNPLAVGRVIEIGSGQLVTVREVVQHIHHLIPGSPAPKFGSLPDRVNEVVRSAETVTAERILNWKASTPLVEGLSMTIEHYAGILRSSSAPGPPAW